MSPPAAASTSASGAHLEEECRLGFLVGLTMDDIRMDQVRSSSTTSAPLDPQEDKNFPGDGATRVNPAGYSKSLPSIFAYSGPIS